MGKASKSVTSRRLKFYVPQNTMPRSLLSASTEHLKAALAVPLPASVFRLSATLGPLAILRNESRNSPGIESVYFGVGWSLEGNFTLRESTCLFV